MFENRVLRRIFWPKRDEVAREWEKLHNDGLNDLYSSPNIVRVIESRKWAEHVAGMGESRGVYRCWLKNLRERDHLEDPVVDGRIISRCIFTMWDVRAWTGST